MPHLKAKVGNFFPVSFFSLKSNINQDKDAGHLIESGGFYQMLSSPIHASDHVK